MQADFNIRSVGVSVIVLNWNGFDDTRKCVQSLLHQTGVGDVEIILVDNASEPKEQSLIHEAFDAEPKVRVVMNAENLGFGKAHNQVFRQLRSEGKQWVACLNNDAVAEPQWLSAMLRRAEREGCSMVTSKMLYAADDSKLDNVGHFMLNTGEIIPKGFGEDAGQYNEPESTLGPCAGACLYDLQCLEKLGYFDDHFFVGYEDAELGLRAWLAGYECFYEPQAIVRHKVSASLNKVRSVDYLASIQAHIFYTWFKLMPPSVLWSNMPWLVLKYSAVLVIDIVMLRLRFLKVMWKGISTAVKNRGLIQEARSDFYNRVSVVRPHREISSRMVFFLWFDIQRFWKFIVLRKKSNLEA